MKRSQINRAIDDFVKLLRQQGFLLPPWATWSPEKWATIGPEAEEVRRCGLGWDVTSFGGADFLRQGLTLFTIRNGLPSQPAPSGGSTASSPPGGSTANSPPGGKDYCEKIMRVGERQVTPLHFHHAKMEDIIHRGGSAASSQSSGGELVMQLYHATKDERLDERSPVTVQVDGFTRTLPAGGPLILEPGESVTLPPRLYHAFWAQPGGGAVLAGEVSRVNDDAKDNRFLEPLKRYPDIEEDEPRRFVLCTEYPKAR